MLANEKTKICSLLWESGMQEVGLLLIVFSEFQYGNTENISILSLGMFLVVW